MPPFGSLSTPRLILRPFAVEDAERFYEIQSDWNVVRNLRAAAWPVTLKGLRSWLGGAAEEWAAGTAFRFSILLEGRVIGCVDVDEIRQGWGDLGYWLGREAWGRGIATEAADALRQFSFNEIGLAGMNSGHAVDNVASGRVLRKLGFQSWSETRLWSNPRQGEIVQIRYRLERSA